MTYLKNKKICLAIILPLFFGFFLGFNNCCSDEVAANVLRSSSEADAANGSSDEVAANGNFVGVVS